MNWSVPLDDSLYRVLAGRNEIAVMGCGITVFLQWHSPGTEPAGTTCRPGCMPGHPVIATDGTCSGVGCCSAMNVQSDSNMFPIKYSVEKENLQVNSSLALVESKWWSKKKNVMVLQKAVSSDTSLGASKGVLHSIPGVPVRTAVRWWVFSNLSCAEASNSSDFGCLSDNSECLEYHEPDDSRGGYTCQCWHGYEGNPYVQHGCQRYVTRLPV